MLGMLNARHRRSNKTINFFFFFLRLGHGYQAYFKVKKDWDGTKLILKSTYKLPKPILKFIVATSKFDAKGMP